MSTGLITQSEWESAYRFYYTDLSRASSPADDDKGRSISMTFTNTSPMVLDYYIIVGFEREISISTSTGALIA